MENNKKIVVLIPCFNEEKTIGKVIKEYTIVEDSPKDNYWGWGINRKGENHLGKIWMKLREEYKNKSF